jgi:hypothetical protein
MKKIYRVSPKYLITGILLSLLITGILLSLDTFPSYGCVKCLFEISIGPIVSSLVYAGLLLPIVCWYACSLFFHSVVVVLCLISLTTVLAQSYSILFLPGGASRFQDHLLSHEFVVSYSVFLVLIQLLLLLFPQFYSLSRVPVGFFN